MTSFIRMQYLFKDLKSIGFSGSRSPSKEAQEALKELLNLVPKDAKISVGCAKGVDAIARNYFQNSNLEVFSVSSGEFGTGRAAFARRSSACVLSVAEDGLLVAVPSSVAPVGVKVGKSFNGKGSGTWGSIAYALGHQRKVLVWSHKVPSWEKVSWSKLENNWWLGVPAAVPAQLSLF
ncbi:MAG: hypothetical protein AB4372_23460 [Xenococcus sp. (in: cyanobacteria)]